jgi:hypothetical protein
MRFLAAYAMRGRLEALAAICGLAMASLALPPLGLLSSALLGLVALRQGVKASAFVLLFALLGLGLSVLLLTGDAFSGLLYGVLLWLPLWPMALLLRATRRLEWAVEAGAGLGLLAVFGVYLLVSDPAAQGREKLRQIAQPMLENVPADFDASALTQAMDWFSHFLTGAMVGSSVISVILSLLIARWLQAMLFNPGGFRSEFVALRLHSGVAYAALACVAVGLSGGGFLAEMAWNLGIVVFMLCTLAGFAIVHALLGSKGFWIVGVYLVLLFAPQFLLPPVALLGLSDPWLDWRKHSKRV